MASLTREPPSRSATALKEYSGDEASETHAAIRELSRHRGRGTTQDHRVLDGRAALHRLLTEELPERQLRVRKVTDLDELQNRLGDIGRSTRRELLSLHSGDVPSKAMLDSSSDFDHGLMERGAHLRIVFPTSAASVDYMRDYVHRESQLGANFRFADAVPYRMIISDNARAIIPLVAEEEVAGAIITTEPVLVRALRHLAQSMMRRGVDIGSIDPANPRTEPTELELKVIRVMSLGLTDDVAAKRLAVSDRTFRRYAAQVMERLGAVSRFQAGVRAVERGWL